MSTEQTWFNIGGADISLGSIKAALGLAGLHVVTASDKAVLDATSRIAEDHLRAALAVAPDYSPGVYWANAVLNSRGVK